MRVSFESGRETTSPVGPAPTSSRQQPVPAMVTVVVSFRQKPCGVFMPGGVPEPGCRCLGGTPYWPTGRTWLDRLTAGDAEFSDEVLVIVHATSCCDVRVPYGAGDRLLRLIGGVRAQEVLGPAVAGVERASAGRLRRPDREARLRGARLARGVDQPRSVEVLHRHVRCACGELRLRERVDLRAGEAVANHG